MAPQQVLRCFSCHLFQVHQVKKSLKWTCKACGEKQSFLRMITCERRGLTWIVRWCVLSAGTAPERDTFDILYQHHSSKAYGEGSGADCRRHVQKLNLLQGQASEMLLRSLEEPVNAKEEEGAGHQQTENETLQPTESRWLKYLEKGSKELEPEEGMYFNRPPPSKSEEPASPFRNNISRKRKWSPCPVQPPGSGRRVDSEVTLYPQDCTDQTGKVKQGSCLQNSEDWNTSEFTVPQWESPRPAEQVASSKWEQFLLSPGKSSHVDTESPGPLQTGPRSADPAQPETWTLRKGRPRRSPAVLQPPWASHAATGVGISYTKHPWDPKTYHTEGKPTVKVEHQPQPVLLSDLFKTEEDFDDDL